MPKVGRPMEYHADTLVRLHVTGTSKLQKASARRAVINLIVENGGSMTIGEIDEHFDFSMRDVVMGLVHTNWLEVVQ